MIQPSHIAIPLPGEIFYSVLARTQTMGLCESPAAFSLTYFGKTKVPATIDLPGHIQHFHNAVADIFPLNPNEIIENLTLWPFYSRFTRSYNRETVYNLLLGHDSTTIHTKIGINSSASNKILNLKYCPICIKEDQTKYGQNYWHRSHQIPDMFICQKHLVELVPYVANFSELSRSHFIDSNLVLSQAPCQSTCTTDKRQVALAKTMNDLLDGNSTFDVNEVDYLSTVKSFYRQGKQIDGDRLRRDFEKYYSVDLINKVLLGAPNDWLLSIVRRPFHFFHPIRHILISEFLNSLEKDNFNSVSQLENGPWRCLNHAAEHFGQYVITTIQFHWDSKSKREIGVLKCSCGMVYSQSWAGEEKPKKKIVRILEWGAIWKNRLRIELEAGHSYRQIARVLGTDAKTVSKYAKQGPSNSKVPSSNTEEISKLRNEWAKLLNQFDFNQVSQARALAPATYAQLRRKDFTWFSAINKLSTSHSRAGELRLDWPKLDDKIHVLISDTVDKLKSEGYKGRITKSLISKIIRAQHFLLSKHASKLPKSRSLLNSSTENTEAFLLRRIDLAITELTPRGFVKWRVMRKAGLTKSRLTPFIEHQLEKKLYG